MYASSEKALIKKDYKENIYHNNIWNYFKKNDHTTQAYLSWDYDYKQWNKNSPH